MKAFANFSVLLILFFTSSLFALDKGDKDSINEIVEHFTSSWNHHEGKGFADYSAEDSDFVNIFGSVFSGKQEIESRHIAILKTFLKGSTF